MRKIDKPDIQVKDVVKTCIGNYKDRDKIERFKSSLGEIVHYSETFHKKMESGTAFEIKKHNEVNEVKKEEMVALYKDKFAHINQPGRKYYDKILSSAPRGKCPICGVRTATTLDHFMAKALYPALAVTPENLVPICRDCNTVKQDVEFVDYESTHLHPYYDDIDNDIWLEADVEIGDDITVSYHVRKVEKWEDSFYKRVKNHVQLFDLQTILSLQAVDEVESIKGILRKLGNSAGKEAVYQHLKDMLESNEAISRNSWRTALYRNLYRNEAFMEYFV